MKHLIITLLTVSLYSGLNAQISFTNGHHHEVEKRSDIIPSFIPQMNKKTSGTFQQLDSYELFFWNTTSQNYFKRNETSYLYHPNGSLYTSEQLSYKETNNPISRGIKYIYEYNSDSTLLTQSYLRLDTITGDWNPIGKWEIHYNSVMAMDYFDYYLWNETTLIWDLSYKYEYHYTVDGKIELVDGAKWNSGTKLWENYYQESTLYDANGLDTLYREFDWIADSNSWVIQRKEQFEYDAKGNNVKETIVIYYSGGGFSSQQWVNTFDTDDKMIKKESFVWNGPVIQWTKFYIQDYTYNTFNDVEYIEAQTNDAGSWQVSRKTNFLYNTSIPSSDLILPNSSNYNRQILGRTSIEMQSNTWENFDMATYNYSNFPPVSVAEVEINSSKPFPNPFNATISFKLHNIYEKCYLQVFDACGKIVVDQLISHEEKVDTQLLQPGFYFYKLTNSKGKITGKLIKD